jgi:outer membrane protein
MKKSLLLTVFLVAAIQATNVFAYEKGDWILRVGAATVNPDDDSSNLELDGAGLPGTGVDVDSDTQVGLTATYMFHDNWGLGILAATPFKHDIDLDGVAGLDDVGDTKHLPPTVTVQYHFDTDSRVKPYVGAGLNYTTFFSEDLDDGIENALGAQDIKLDDSTGLALEFGIDVHFGENMLFNASVWHIDIDTKADIDLRGGSEIEVDVDIDPWVYMVGIGWRF